MAVASKRVVVLRSAILLEAKVASVANNVAELSKDVRDIDKPLVRIETVLEFGTRGGFPATTPAIEDGRS